LESFLFAPTHLGAVAAVPSSFQDLANALLQSQFGNNPQLGSVLTSASVLESPLTTLLYGQRVFSASAGSTISYSYSPRLNFTFDVGGARSQHLSDSQPLAAGNGTLALNSTSGHAGASFSYSLSPRTQIGGSVESSRSVSQMYDTYATVSTLSLSHSLGRRWILDGHGGVGVTDPVRQIGTVIASVKPYPSAGGSITYKTGSHTFLASFDRTVNNSYGLGASTGYTGSASWRWRIPGRQWWVDSSFSYQQLDGGGLTNTSGWHSTTGFNQAIGHHTAFRAEYAYINYSGGLQSSAYKLAESAVRVSLIWFPETEAIR